MTVALVTNAIRAFLESSTPQVLCIRGKWGVGKTFVWEGVFKKAKADGVVALPNYCYVSLFGLQSIDEVRQVIFENSVNTRKVDISPTIESFAENLSRYFKLAVRSASKISTFAKIPYMDRYISNFSGGFRQIISLVVRDTIICFDDFERKKISTKDLLGLISLLKESKGCKAVIILSEDALTSDERDEFRRYFEKVIDIPMEFSPTAEECADIAVTEHDEVSDWIRENSIILGISNIRIIHRIYNAAQDIAKIIGSYRRDIRYQTIHTLTLLIWSKYGDDVPPLNFIFGREYHSYLFDKKNISEDEKRWAPLLDKYNFSVCDEFDKIIFSGVERGFFNRDELVREADLQDRRVADITGKQVIQDAWKFLHASFDDNEADVVQRLYSAYKDNPGMFTINSLDEVVMTLRILGYPDKASDLVRAYVDASGGRLDAASVSNSPFGTSVRDEELKAAITASVVVKTRRPASEVLREIGEQKFSDDNMTDAVSFSEDELYNAFKSARGFELDEVVRGALFFKQISNATDEQRGLTQRSIAALQRIGKDSALNSIRLKKFFIQNMTPPSQE